MEQTRGMYKGKGNRYQSKNRGGGRKEKQKLYKIRKILHNNCTKAMIVLYNTRNEK